MNIPKNLKYAKTHEWVRVEEDIAVVGLTDHAQHELTDVVYVELPGAGAQVEAAKECAVVESVKSANDVYSPVTGRPRLETPNALWRRPLEAAARCKSAGRTSR